LDLVVVFDQIAKHIDEPGQMVLVSLLTKELNISEEKFWKYAKQLKRLGIIYYNLNYVGIEYMSKSAKPDFKQL